MQSHIILYHRRIGLGFDATLPGTSGAAYVSYVGLTKSKSRNQMCNAVRPHNLVCIIQPHVQPLGFFLFSMRIVFAPWVSARRQSHQRCLHIRRAFLHPNFFAPHFALFRLGILLPKNEAFKLEDIYISISNMHMPSRVCQCSV